MAEKYSERPGVTGNGKWPMTTDQNHSKQGIFCRSETTMRKVLTAVTVLILLLGACSNQQSPYDQAMKQGQKAIQSEQYAAAEAYYRQALKAKSADRNALAYLNQLKNFQTAVDLLKQGNPQSAINAANKVLMEKNGSGTLIRRARTLKDFALAEQSPSQSGTSETVTAGSDSQAASSAGGSSGSTASATSVSTSAGTSESSTSSSDVQATVQTSGGAVKTADQKQAEAAVVRAAGYTMSQVYVATRDSGVYYSIELRENHSNNSAADPNTAPSIGFFRYYKSSGKITELDIASNQYKPVPN